MTDAVTNERVVVRPARGSDAGRIADIYNQGIRARIATFETRERTAADIRRWLDDDRWPVLVAEDIASGAVCGWAAGYAYRDRACYAGIAEFSVYVDEDHRGRRIGDVLLAAFLSACEARGIWKVLSRVFPENAASRALCERHGFREVGTYCRHATLDGRWRDVVIVERLLGAAANG